MMKNKRDSWFNSGDMITRLIICTIILIIICSQSFVVGEKITLQLIGSIINHNSIYVLILVYFIFVRTKFGKKYFNYLNVILMLIYAISSFTSFLTVVQAFSLSSLLDFIVEALLLIYMIHTLFRDTLGWKEFKLAKSPFNELSNANIFYSIVILSLSVLLVNLISIVALDGVLIAFLDAIYMVLLSRYIYLYREYLDENKIDANNDGNFVSLGTLTSDIPGMISLSTFSNSVTLTSDTFKIKVTGSGTDYVDSISIFTNYTNSTSTKSISAKVYDNNYLEYNEYKQMFMIAITARNYGTGASFSQSVYNKNTNSYVNNLGSIFGFQGMINLYNDALILNINFFNSDMPYGEYEYHLKDSSGNIIARADFSIKPTVTYNTNKIVLDVGETYSGLGYSINYNNGSSANPSSTIGYRSDNPNIATFTSGTVRGIASGDTTVGLTVTINGVTFYYPILVSIGEIGFGDYILEGSYIYISANTTKTIFENNIRADGCTLEYSPNNNFISTGTTLTIRKNNVVKGTYTIIVLGDVNSDGKISIADVSRLYNFFMNIIQIDNANQIKAGDVNKDSRISIADVSRLYNYFMNIIPEL